VVDSLGSKNDIYFGTEGEYVYVCVCVYMSSTCFSRTKKILLHNNIIIPTKLLQTKEECENLKRGCAVLTQENRRLQGEVAELRALLTNPASFTATNQLRSIRHCAEGPARTDFSCTRYSSS